MSQENESNSKPATPSPGSEPPAGGDAVNNNNNSNTTSSNSNSNSNTAVDVSSPASANIVDSTAQQGQGQGQGTDKESEKEQGSNSKPSTGGQTQTAEGKGNSNSNPNSNSNSNQYSPNANVTRSYSNEYVTATPLSPPYHMQHQHPYYYSQNVNGPNSPATPSYEFGAQNILSNNMFMRQQYPVIPPLSPHVANNNPNVVNDVAGLEGDSNGNGGPGGGGGAMHGNINHNLSMGTVPPASPLFPGTLPIFGSEHLENAGRSMHMMGMAPNSPSLQYLGGPPPSPVISYGGIYQASPEQPSWSDRSMQQQHMYPTTTPSPSPHIQSVQYQHSQSRRTTSFDGNELLPPSALEDNGSPVYTTNAAAGGATLFSQQQPWGYNLNPPLSSLQQHLHVHPHNQHLNVNVHQMRSPPRAPRGGREAQGQMQGQVPGLGPGPGGSPPPAQQGGMYFPAATPGPPIQTTQHNKGPEGANLFIFHIPNHFTNLDMWQLFCNYGTLLSVRIMVEKDTGRSRGFGFVSYDSPEAAALAIKELNGFVIGNKRLKVQHKQIRAGEASLPGDDKDLDQGFEQGFAQGQPQYQHVVAGGHPMMLNQVTGYNLPPNQGMPVMGGGADGHEQHGHGHGLDQNQVESSYLNLDTIGESLPEVAN